MEISYIKNLVNHEFVDKLWLKIMIENKYDYSIVSLYSIVIHACRENLKQYIIWKSFHSLSIILLLLHNPLKSTLMNLRPTLCQHCRTVNMLNRLTTLLTLTHQNVLLHLKLQTTVISQSCCLLTCLVLCCHQRRVALHRVVLSLFTMN